MEILEAPITGNHFETYSTSDPRGCVHGWDVCKHCTHKRIRWNSEHSCVMWGGRIYSGD